MPIPFSTTFGTLPLTKVWYSLFDGVIVVMMPDAETLWIEALVGATTEPTSWAFTENKTVFER